jgi:protein O-GlcNAc transferase
LAEWIADTPADYLQRALALSGDLPRLTRLRAQLRERLRTSLCDRPAFAREVELAYRHLWQRWCIRQHVPGERG